MTRLRHLLPIAFLLGGAPVALSATPAHATLSCPTLGSGGSSVALTQSQSVSPSDGSPFIVCTGRVRSFDGTPLHIDVTLPTASYTPLGSSSPVSPPPLLMFLSGWSNDICQFESQTVAGSAVAGCSDWIGNAGWHWNNAWAASKGLVSLTYTPRGWYESCGKVASSGYSYATDPTCSDTAGEQSWVHLYDRRFEIRDAQYLAGLLVDAGLVDPAHIVTSGDSGGGGPSWDLALSQDQVVQLNSTPASVHTLPWTSPNGTAMHLAAALPMYTWTDLADALISNGRASDGFDGAPPDGNHASPVGVEKATYVTGLFLKGLSNVPGQPQYSAQYADPCPTTACSGVPCATLHCDPTADLQTWFTEINAGEPTFAANPDTPNIVAQVGGALRSPFAIPVPADNSATGSLNTVKPIFVVQGLTDPLFPGNQALTMINRLKNASSAYPVYAYLGDVGHSYADNPLDVWQQAHTEGDAWLLTVLTGNLHPSAPPLSISTTQCVSGQTQELYSGASLPAIASGSINVTDATTHTTVHVAPASPPTATYEGSQTDPIVHSGCRSMAASQSDPSPSQATYSFNVGPTTLLGAPVITINSGTLNASSAELAVRLWDLDPGGTQTLIARSVYRFDEGTSVQNALDGTSFELTPNAWQLMPGHMLKLELTQDDFPVWRPDNEPATITITSLTLRVPVAGVAPSATLPEAALTPALPAAAAVAGIAALLVRRRRRRLLRGRPG